MEEIMAIKCNNLTQKLCFLVNLKFQIFPKIFKNSLFSYVCEICNQSGNLIPHSRVKSHPGFGWIKEIATNSSPSSGNVFLLPRLCFTLHQHSLGSGLPLFYSSPAPDIFILTITRSRVRPLKTIS